MAQIVEAIRNTKTGKLFVVVDGIGNRLQVITPDGKTVSLPEHLFEDEPQILEGDAVAANLTPEQLAAIDSQQEADQEEVRQHEIARQSQREAEQKRLAEEAARPTRSPSTRSSSGGTRRRKPANDKRTGLGATWNSPNLTFYRHKIQPLGPKQTFIVEVANVGRFRMSKAEFEANFNDALMSKSYRVDGFFTYTEIPEKAQRFLMTVE